jgi:hypothetical protein
MFSDSVYRALDQASQAPPDDLHIPQRLWARLLYELVATYHHLDKQRDALIPNITPLYLGQVASFVNQTQDLDFWDAEAVIESLAQTFEQEKPYLLNRWNSKL